MPTKIVDVSKGVEEKRLPLTQKVVAVEWTDDETGQKRVGEFTLKRMNLGDLRKAAIRRAQLNGGLPEAAIDEDTRFMNMMLANLEMTIVQSPDWWKPEEFYNGRVIYDLYNEVISFEATFRSALRGGTSGAQGDRGQPSGLDGAPPAKVVVPQVQPSANA